MWREYFKQKKSPKWPNVQEITCHTYGWKWGSAIAYEGRDGQGKHLIHEIRWGHCFVLISEVMWVRTMGYDSRRRWDQVEEVSRCSPTHEGGQYHWNATSGLHWRVEYQTDTPASRSPGKVHTPEVLHGKQSPCVYLFFSKLWNKERNVQISTDP